MRTGVRSLHRPNRARLLRRDVADSPPMRLSRTALAAFFSFSGILHFLRPRPYEAIVPPPFPKKESVAISGVAEIVGAVAVLHPATRPAARWWLIALLLAIFPANVWMAVSPEKVPGAG